ncbi:MAG TPA: LysR family transcriptional regulator [Vicinamibacterales bacterium]|nr:LysR family transcriptional regulator [Vicinamibacterales bacterium]
MVHDELNVLSAFLAVAEERSFTRAARRLGVSPSAVSHAMRGLEEGIGVRLLARTTRSVSPTEAGAQLLAHLSPALVDIRGALERISGLRDKPAGRVRLLVTPLAAHMVLAPKLGQFARRYPDVVLDVTTTGESRVDIVAAGFDAGIHLGEFIERDMIAVRVSADQRAAIVASPAYFQSQPKPKSPRDLPGHRCINFKHGSEGVYRWEFDKGKRSLAVSVSGPLIVDDVQTLIRAAIDGVGLAFMLEAHAEPHLASGALVRVLEDWCPPFAGYFLYYPSRRQQPAALSALIDTLRLQT